MKKLNTYARCRAMSWIAGGAFAALGLVALPASAEDGVLLSLGIEASDVEVLPNGGPALELVDASDISPFEGPSRDGTPDSDFVLGLVEASDVRVLESPEPLVALVPASRISPFEPPNEGDQGVALEEDDDAMLDLDDDVDVDVDVR